MRDLNTLNGLRDTSPKVIEHYKGIGDSTCGVFNLTGVDGMRLCVVASSGRGWEHVSVSSETRCPTWDEMNIVKQMFFKVSETVMQLHVPLSDHINKHPYCLHLWRPKVKKIPRPPSWMVG